ncbi:hypothetical protein [Bradyrhizobium hereditatis]|uniref:hypothetical protein n=1 Tax=Bradyrhizobium hereditatis TaxID=2821405 RepID=UPI001CE296B9|nr:hypothetical protein [Bradyrhizobium hereditatis]
MNRLPNPPLLLPVWICPLAIVDNGANGGLKGDAGAVGGTGVGAGAETVLEERPESPRAARRAGLGCRPSTVTCGISISAGAFGDPAAVAGAGAVCDAADAGGACTAAGACAGGGVSAGGAA